MKWFARRGNVGGTARAVAKAWKTIKFQHPDMNPQEIAEAYIKFRYGITGESRLESEVLRLVSRGLIEGPVSLAWGIFLIENPDEPENFPQVEEEWMEIMSEELTKVGVEPEPGWDEPFKWHSEYQRLIGLKIGKMV